MLQIIKTESPKDKNKIIRNFRYEPNTTLIVSDLQSKLYWQLFGNGKVLRASEFWMILLDKIEPNLILLDEQATLIRLQQAIDISSDINLKKIKPRSFLKYFYELFPLFSHPATTEIMQYWFAEKKQTEPANWEALFYFCKNIWDNLKQENILPVSAVAPFLLHSLNYEFQWHTALVFDLGGNLKTTETDLILTLSQQLNVSVIEPRPNSIADFHWLSWPYQQLKTRSFKEIPAKICDNDDSITLNNFLRFSNPLSEIKMAISQIKNWITEGVSTDKIYITAPNIEEYWSALKWHLDQEQLGYCKEPAAKFIEILSLKKLISQLKCSFLRSIDKKDLESALFIDEPIPPLKYAEFNQLYSELYSAKNYFRNHKVGMKLNANTTDSEMSAEDFIAILTNLHSIEPFDENKKFFFEQIKAKIQSGFSLHYKAEIRYWIYFLDQILQKKEFAIVSKQNSNGIQIIPLPSVYALSDFKCIFLGLCESSLKSNSSVINGSDVISLLNKTGHLLDHPDRNYFDFLLQWSDLTKNGHIFSFSETNWQTEDLTPSVFWLLGHSQSIKTTIPLASIVIKDNPTSEISGSHKKIKPFKNINTSDIFKTLSPSGLEKFNDCAFKYYTERLLNLNEDKILDLDPSPLTLGSLYHKLCELLTAEPLNFKLTDLEWQKIIETTLKSSKSTDLLDFQRTDLKIKLIKWGKLFLENEQSLRISHTESRVFARELKFSGKINNIIFNGKIDRMDWDQNLQYSIVDYKSSVSYLSGPLSWIKNNQLQLLSYVYAAKKDWLSTKDISIISSSNYNISGAYYLSLKNFDRKGFTSENCSSTFLSPLSSKSQLAPDTIDELLSEFEDILYKTIDKLKEGNFEPIPRNESICHECSWSHLCRAPHLNT